MTSNLQRFGVQVRQMITENLNIDYKDLDDEYFGSGEYFNFVNRARRERNSITEDQFLLLLAVAFIQSSMLHVYGTNIQPPEENEDDEEQEGEEEDPTITAARSGMEIARDLSTTLELLFSLCQNTSLVIPEFYSGLALSLRALFCLGPRVGVQVTGTEAREARDRLPATFAQSELGKLVTDIVNAYSVGRWLEFLHLYKKCPYFFGCVMHTFLFQARVGAFREVLSVTPSGFVVDRNVIADLLFLSTGELNKFLELFGIQKDTKITAGLSRSLLIPTAPRLTLDGNLWMKRGNSVVEDLILVLNPTQVKKVDPVEVALQERFPRPVKLENTQGFSLETHIYGTEFQARLVWPNGYVHHLSWNDVPNLPSEVLAQLTRAIPDVGVRDKVLRHYVTQNQRAAMVFSLVEKGDIEFLKELPSEFVARGLLHLPMEKVLGFLCEVKVSEAGLVLKEMPPDVAKFYSRKLALRGGEGMLQIALSRGKNEMDFEFSPLVQVI